MRNVSALVSLSNKIQRQNRSVPNKTRVKSSSPNQSPKRQTKTNNVNKTFTLHSVEEGFALYKVENELSLSLAGPLFWSLEF